MSRNSDRPDVVMPSLRPSNRSKGRSVAKEPAVMARPCSAVDQMAISTVAPVFVLLVTMNEL